MIRWAAIILQNFLRTDIHYLARGSFWLGIGRIFGALVAFGLSVLYARYLPKELYGDYRYVLSGLGALGIFALPGVATVITRGVARGFEGTFRRGSLLIFASSFGVMLGGFGIAVWFFLHGNAVLGWGFIVAALFMPFAEGLGNWRAYFDGRRMFYEKTLWNIGANLFYGLSMMGAVGIILMFSLYPWQSLIVLLGMSVLGHALPNIVAYLFAMRRVPRGAPSEQGALRYGVYLSFLDVPSTVVMYLDGILLHAFIGPSALAIYSFAIAAPEQMKGLMSAAAITAFPKISQRTDTIEARQEIKKTLPAKLLRASLFTALAVAAYILAAPFLFHIFLPAYQESVPYSKVFAVSLVFFPFGLFGTALKTEGNLKKVFGYQTAAPVAQIIFLFLLIPSFGLWGAIAGRLLGRFFALGFEWAFFMYGK